MNALKDSRPALISSNADAALTGALTLEGFGFEVDLITKKLKKAPIYLP